MNSITSLSPKALRTAADLQEKIQSLQEELGQILDGGASTPAEPTETPKKKWKFSAAARAKMRASQKARWAKIKGTTVSATPEQKPKRKLSAARKSRYVCCCQGAMGESEEGREEPVVISAFGSRRNALEEGVAPFSLPRSKQACRS